MKNSLPFTLALALLASCISPALAQRPATSTAPATTTAPAASSAAATALYDEALQRYLTADWETLASDLTKNARDFTPLSKDQQADIAYLRQAVTDGRPLWWNTIKQNKKSQFTTRIWQRTFTTTFDPTTQGMTFRSVNGQVSISVNWGTTDMDSTANAEHGFTKGDLAYVGIWQTLEAAEIFSNQSIVHLNSMSAQDRAVYNRYVAFRGALTAAYYGTPRARRWAAFLSCDAYLASHLSNDAFIPRKPLAAMLVAEIISHPAKYPSLHPARNINPDNAEGSLATGFMSQFERTILPFAEDKALREALKDFAAANTTPSSGKVILPNKLIIPLNPAEDTDTSQKRNAWLMEQLQSAK